MSNHDLTALAMISAVEKRVSARIEAAKLTGPKGDRGQRGTPGKSIKGDPGDSVQGERGKDGVSIRGPKGNDGASKQGERGVAGKSIKGIKGDKGESIKGERGLTGDSVKGDKGNTGPRPAHKWDGTNLTFQRADGQWGKTVNLAGKSGLVVHRHRGGVAPNKSGIATLDFADDSNIATVDVTGVSEITATSVVIVQMRIEATADNTVSDLLIDPIRVTVSALDVGVGFTIYGTMNHGPAQGLYLVNWSVA